MATEITLPRSRRAVLAAAVGAGAATVASALGRPEPVRAADVVLGGVNDETTTTTIQNTTNANAVLWAASSTGEAMHAASTSGTGLSASSTSSYGLVSGSVSNYAIYALNWAVDQPSAYVWAKGNHCGVVGFSSGSGDPPAVGPAKTGVYGSAVQDAAARGVYGQTTVGQAVRGEATTGVGVYATAASTGTALQVAGKAKFNRASRVLIGHGKSSYKKTLAGVTASSQVFAVLRTYRSGTYVAAVVCGTGYFTIYLNRALAYDTYVSYFVVN